MLVLIFALLKEMSPSSSDYLQDFLSVFLWCKSWYFPFSSPSSSSTCSSSPSPRPPLLPSSFMLYIVYRFSWMWRLMSFNSLGQFCTFISSNIASVLFSPFFFPQDFFHYEIKNTFLLFLTWLKIFSVFIFSPDFQIYHKFCYPSLHKYSLIYIFLLVISVTIFFKI